MYRLLCIVLIRKALYYYLVTYFFNKGMFTLTIALKPRDRDIRQLTSNLLLLKNQRKIQSNQVLTLYFLVLYNPLVLTQNIILIPTKYIQRQSCVYQIPQKTILTFLVRRQLLPLLILSLQTTQFLFQKRKSYYIACSIISSYISLSYSKNTQSKHYIIARSTIALALQRLLSYFFLRKIGYYAFTQITIV